MGAGELGIGREHAVRAAVELEVERPPREVFVELDILALALLPPRGDGCDRSLGDSKAREDVSQERRLILGSEKEDSRHSALTFTASPT